MVSPPVYPFDDDVVEVVIVVTAAGGVVVASFAFPVEGVVVLAAVDTQQILQTHPACNFFVLGTLENHQNGGGLFYPDYCTRY